MRSIIELIRNKRECDIEEELIKISNIREVAFLIFEMEDYFEKAKLKLKCFFIYISTSVY
ncbi:hypothetical protein KL86DYS1_10808 [uncultured Dysgonomonas sp.]|uniref:Uncharacterized protein n=1 Tax=uncultured Dysgonomonas sp. TaxID=206096 RepID=A0A212J152_9BACT|nr:hypothetical protein KL86DYS1_10808 [uncultured Dysgonomonas sp.]